MAKRKKIIKRKGRFARFSGATVKYAVRTELALVTEGEDKATVKSVEIPVGPIHFSKQVVNTGRGPNPERMQHYYNSVKPEAFEKPTPIRTSEQMESWLKQYDTILRETPRTNRLVLVENSTGRLDLFYSKTAWFFVDVDLQQQSIKRSRDYSTKAVAIDRLKNGRLVWVEELSIQRLPPPGGR